MRKIFILAILGGILAAWSQSGSNYLSHGEFRWITIHDAFLYLGILPLEPPTTGIGKVLVGIGDTIGRREIGQVGVFALILLNIPFWWKTLRLPHEGGARKDGKGD